MRFPDNAHLRTKSCHEGWTQQAPDSLWVESLSLSDVDVFMHDHLADCQAPSSLHACEIFG